MSNLRVTELVADTGPTLDDLLMTINAPGTTPGNKKVTIADFFNNVGTKTATPTSSPSVISMGATYSTTPGANLKFKLFDDGNPSNNYGFGISSGAVDYVTQNTHNWWISTNLAATLAPIGFTSVFLDTGGAVFNFKAYGGVGDGTTDNASALNSLITSVNGLGGGVIVISNGVYAIGSTITLQTDVILVLNGSTIKWIGSSGGGPMFTTSSSVGAIRTGILGTGSATIDANSLTTTIFTLHSVNSSKFCDLNIKNTTATTKVFRLLADAASAVGAYINTGVNDFHNIHGDYDNVGTVVELDGSADTGGGVVTLNRFSGFFFSDVNVFGLRFVKWCDNNYFKNINLGFVASNAVAIILNDSSDPTSSIGVYENQFHEISLDAITGAFSNRSGIIFNNCDQCVFHNVHSGFGSTEFENGLIVDNYATSYYVLRSANTSDTNIRVHSKGMRFGINTSATVPAYPIDCWALGDGAVILNIQDTSSNSSTASAKLGFSTGAAVTSMIAGLYNGGNFRLDFGVNGSSAIHMSLLYPGLLGLGTTSPTYVLHIAPTAGSTAGQTFFLQDAKASTGATKGVVKAGAGQSTTNLWEWQDSSGTPLTSIAASGVIKPVHLADGSAPNDSIYYSTTASKLVYKDGGGVVNNLY